ncbi:hypothetical protein SRABI76_03534 [Microbacterium oxydans]|uniref:DUF2442 domain-containing protein n=1 Tax=Microbacterium oxydans TaxID=82380 RepID=A0A0F0LIE8_9MICO|nr:DUF2442 domain-containing protein [Microbacterium oxydans]KJL32439.1 hypothetical protein RS83_00226 [Microbacterium oxydans]CAH0262916.1 hypothetical protein SRABI76_03534 [Microbacterium oxydans]
MSTSIDAALAVGIEIDDQELHVRIKDGRTISVPLGWFPRLANASAAERLDWRLIGEGEGIRWHRIDEDISISALLRGR